MSELTIEAIPENLQQVFDFIIPKMEATGCDKKTIRTCKLCAEEIFTNIASYAYDPKVGYVKVGVDIETVPPPIKLVFSFTDEGVPYDPLSHEDPDLEADLSERQIGGLGIFLVKDKMDDMTYEYKDGKNILRIVKNLE